MVNKNGKNAIMSALAVIMAVCAVGLSACGTVSDSGLGSESATFQSSGTEETPAHEHIWEKVSSVAATCGAAGRDYYECECGAKKTRRTTSATAEHTFGTDYVCDDCGYVDMSRYTCEEAISDFGYYLLDEDESETYSTGDIVLFGSYPQKLVTDEETVAALAPLQGELPTGTESGDWVSYGYYDEGRASDYMFYKDITSEGKRYRGVYFLKYRSYYTRLAADAEYSYIDEEGYETETVYWFEYTPIRWVVLDYIEGSLFLNALECLDAQPFQDTYDYDGEAKQAYVPGTKTYMNDWASSSLRAFLNGSFKESAFSEEERALIETVELDNTATGFSTTNEYQICQQSTQDQIFLLSWQDLLNEDYGFTSTVDFDDLVTKQGVDADTLPEGQLRRRGFSDYSTVQGLHRSTVGHTASGESACHYLIRSAGILSYGICGVTKYGSLWNSGILSLTNTASYDTFAGNGNLGVAPSLYLRVTE